MPMHCDLVDLAELYFVGSYKPKLLPLFLSTLSMPHKSFIRYKYNTNFFSSHFERFGRFNTIYIKIESNTITIYIKNFHFGPICNMSLSF